MLGRLVIDLSYEGIVVENRIQPAGERCQTYYFRTQVSTPKLERGFSSACDALGMDARYVVYLA